MNTGEHVKITREDRVAYIVLCRPDTLNLLGTEALRQLQEALFEIERDKDIRAVIISGQGHFCAGADIRELKAMDRQAAEIFSGLGHEVFKHIEDMEKPVIAAVTGYALGGGTELALACDIRLAGEDAKFGLPEINLGLVPGFGGTQRLAGLVGPGYAKELILTGKIIGAEEARAIGLVNCVIKDEEVMAKAGEMARVLSEKSPRMLGLAKGLMNVNEQLKQGLAKEISAFASCFETEDRAEGIEAFLQKRKPSFTGR